MKEIVKFSFDQDAYNRPATKFFINEDKGTVVCKISGTLKGLDDAELYYLKSCPNVDDWYYGLNDGLNVEMTFEGKAKCSPDDKFDTKVGRQIAESRAKMQVYAFIQQLAQKRAEELERQAQIARAVEEKYLNILAVEAGRVEKLVE